MPGGVFLPARAALLALPLIYRGLAPDKESRLSPLTRQALRRFLDLSEWIAALIDEHRIAWEVTVRPTETLPLEVLVAGEQERLGFSEGVSRQWETAEDALAWWRRQIERQGIWEPDGVRGASHWVASRLPFLLINRRDAEAATGRLFASSHRPGGGGVRLSRARGGGEGEVFRPSLCGSHAPPVGAIRTVLACPPGRGRHRGACGVRTGGTTRAVGWGEGPQASHGKGAEDEGGETISRPARHPDRAREADRTELSFAQKPILSQKEEENGLARNGEDVSS